MKKVEQGDLIRIEHSSTLFLVVSSDFFNESGLIVICPAVRNASSDALHVPFHTSDLDGFVLCEDLTSVSTITRRISRRGHLDAGSMLDIIYRVQSIFDMIQHAE